MAEVAAGAEAPVTGDSGATPAAAASLASLAAPEVALAPGQLTLGGGTDKTYAARRPTAAAACSGDGAAAASSREPQPRPELASGPHLRASVVAACAALFAIARLWAPQASLIPFVLLCTTSTSALWCMSEELVISLGPVPVCFLRRRIAYGEVRSVTEVRGGLRTASALAQRVLRPWRPLGFAYGLTLGKELIDLELLPEAQASHGYFMRQPVLVSVDQAEDVIAHVLFRQKYGKDAPLPASLLARSAVGRGARPVKWVVLDALDMLLSWHAQNSTACDACSLILAPIQAAIEAQRAKPCDRTL